MKNLKMIDEMTHDDFKGSRRSVRHLEVLNIFKYYKKALSHEQTAIIPIAVVLTVLSIGLKHNSADAGAATMYLATYVSAALCWCFLAATIFTKLDYAYSWQYLQLKRMTRELLSARSYDEMYAVLEKYAGTDFVILTDASTSDLDDLALTCALIKCKEMLSKYGLSACRINHDVVKLTVANYFQQKFTLPMLSTASEAFNTVIFTDQGVKLVAEG